ncbi:zf-CCHC domain-containing protein [Tanacetum coccineum]
MQQIQGKSHKITQDFLRFCKSKSGFSYFSGALVLQAVAISKQHWKEPPIVKLGIAKNKKEKYKSLALKAKHVLNDDDTSSSDSNDKEYAMVVRDFKKFFGRRGKFVRQPYDDKRNFRKIKEEKREDQRCFKCGDPNHFISDCPKNYSGEQKAFVVESWSNSGDDSKKEEICLMGHSNEITPPVQELQLFRLQQESKGRLLHQQIMMMFPRKKRVKKGSLLRMHYLMEESATKRQKDATKHKKDKTHSMSLVKENNAKTTINPQDTPHGEDNIKTKDAIPDKPKLYTDECTAFANSNDLRSLFSDVGGVVAIRITSKLRLYIAQRSM